MALAGCALSGHAAQPADPAPSTSTHPLQEQSMTTAASSLTAEEIGHRVLKLIDTIHTVDDISPGHVEKVMGVKVNFNTDDPHQYGFGGNLAGDWTYGFGSLADSGGAKPTRLELSFDNKTSRADMAPICKLSYDDYSKFLTGAGFKKSPFYAEHGRLTMVHFTRGPVAVDINPGGDGTHTCVSILTIEVMAAEEIHS
jgi:hypothetical protein